MFSLDRIRNVYEMKDSWMETTSWGRGEQKKGYSGLRGKHQGRTCL